MRVISAILLALILGYVSYTQAVPAGCDTHGDNMCYFVNNQALPFETVYPRRSDIGIHTITNASNQCSLRFTVPHCAGCGWIFSFFPISSLEYPGLRALDVAAASVTSSSLPTASDTTWGELWRNGKNYCDDTINNRVQTLDKDSLHFSNEFSGPCQLTRDLKFLSYAQMKSMMQNGQRVFTENVVNNCLELSSTIFIHAVYPYHPDDITDDYKTLRYSFRYTVTYPLLAVLKDSLDVIRQRDLLASITSDKHLEVVTRLNLRENYSFAGPCTIDNSQGLAGTIIDPINDPGVANTGQDKTIRFISSSPATSSQGFQGRIHFICPVRECLPTGCFDVKQNPFVIDVELAPPSDVVHSTKFIVSSDVFVGTNTNPFQTRLINQAISSGHERVGVAITTQGLPSDFDIAFYDLTICPDSCSRNLGFDVVKFRDGMEDTNANYLYATSHSRGQVASLAGLANSIGFSFDLRSTLTMKVSSWEFKIKLKYTPTGFKRDIFEDERGESAAEDQTETATITKRIDLFPSAMSGATQTSTVADTADKLIAILIPSIAGGLCLMCMFGIVALVGLILLGSILKRGVSGKSHHRIVEDESVPSDSDVDLRNHAV